MTMEHEHDWRHVQFHDVHQDWCVACWAHRDCDEDQQVNFCLPMSKMELAAYKAAMNSEVVEPQRELPLPSTNEHRCVRVLDDILNGLNPGEAADLSSIETVTLIDNLMRQWGEDWLRIRNHLSSIIGAEAIRRSNSGTIQS